MTQPAKSPKDGVSTAQLLARIEALEADNRKAAESLSASEKARISAEAALAEREAKNEEVIVSIMGRQAQEQHIGKRLVPVRTYDHKKKTWVETEAEVDFYRYLVELPPSAGMAIRLGPNQFDHGSIVEVDYNTLRSLKEQVHRSWAHEASIRESENAWGRRPIAATFSMKTGRRVG